MRIALPAQGPAVAAPPLLVAVLAIDLLACAACLVLGVAGGLAGWAGAPAWGPWAVAAYGVAAAGADLAAARLAPAGLAWRRRLAYLAIGAAVWRGGPAEGTALAVAAVLWSGLVWVGLVVGGRALSRAVASATGADQPS